MNALQIMKPRSQDNRIDWHRIENDKFQLPTLFKAFHNVYNISTILNINWFYYKNSTYNEIRAFGSYDHYKIPYLILDTIFKVEELESMLPKMLDAEDDIDQEILKEDVIPIAYCPSQELLMLGIGEHNADKIYYFVRYKEEKLKLVANNIFEFF